MGIRKEEEDRSHGGGYHRLMRKYGLFNHNDTTALRKNMSLKSRI